MYTALVTTTDPLQQFKGVPQGRLIAATGLIPFFVQDVAMSVPLDATEAFDMMLECYGYGGKDTLPTSAGEVQKDGTYTHPEDTDLAPMVSWKFEGEKDTIEVLMYQHELVVVRDKARTHMTRMD
jgi:hypothetical protein